MTSAAMVGGPKARAEDKSWLPPAEEPTPRQKMRMFGMMVRVCIKLAMSNHYYTFNGEIRRQSKGAATGNSLTMELSRLFGSWWDSQYLRKLESLEIKVMKYWRYVDDNGNVLKAIDPGVRLVEDEETGAQRLEVKPELMEADQQKTEDERTANFLSEVANSIHPSISVKADFPSKNPDKRMPLLDLGIWVSEEQKVKFGFYAKDVSSKFFVPYKSAHSQSMKRSMLVNEGMRRLLNISPDLPWESFVKVMDEFAVKMWRSGYPASWRADTVKTSLQKYEDMLREEREGGKPLFRPKSFMEEERAMAKLKKAKQWHKAGGEGGLLAGAPLIVCPGAGSMIAKKMKSVCKTFKSEHKIDVRVYERGGSKVGSIAKSDPLKPESCGRENCFPCTSGGGGDCSKSSVAYRIECEECPKTGKSAHYDGESGNNGFTRGLEQITGLEKKKDENPLWKHCQIAHNSELVKFKMVCLKSFKSAFMRQVNEGVRIENSKADICMNSKAEFHQPSIVRVSTVLGNHNDEQTGGSDRRRGS